MQELKKLFKNKDYNAIIGLIEEDSDYRKNLYKLQYLVSAYYYLGNFEGSIEGIKLLETFDLKMAYSMYIDAHISLGTDGHQAMKCIERYLEFDLNDKEKNWQLFKKGQCLIFLAACRT